MTHRLHTTGVVFAVLTLGLTACKSDPAPAPPVVEQDLKPAPKAHPVFEQVQRVDTNCPKTWREAKSCKALKRLQRVVVQDPKPMNALVNIVADSKSSPRHKDIATQEIERISRVYFDRAAQGAVKLDEETAKTLLGLMRSEVPSRQNKRPQKLIASTVFIHDMLGKHDEVEALFKDLDPAKSPSMLWTVQYGVEALMRHGRLKHFALVKEYAKSPKALLKSAAFKAPRLMVGLTKSELEAICPWASADMNNRPTTQNPNDFGAAWVVLRCAQDPLYATALVEKANALSAQGTLTRPFGLAMRQLCAPNRLPATPAHTQVCAKARKAWVKVIEGKTQPTQARVQAIEALMTQWPDKQTAALMRVHQNSRVPEVAKAATRALARVEPKKKPTEQTPQPASLESPSP